MKIVLAIVLALFTIGCSNDEKKEVAKAEPAKVVEVQAVEETTMPTVQEMKDKVAEVKDSVAAMEVPTAAQVQDSVVETVTEVTQTVKNASAEMAEEVAEVAEGVMPSSIDAKALYAGCISCHGAKGEKKALGKSAVIQGWDASKTVTALKGYKDGSYGGAMKAIMKGQSLKFNDAEIDALGEYISQL